MTIIQRYLKLLKNIYKNGNYIDQYSKLKIDDYKRMPIKAFKAQLQKVDLQLIRNRISQIEADIFYDGGTRIRQGGYMKNGLDLKNQSEGNIIQYKMPSNIMTLKNYLESINVNSINYYQNQYLKSKPQIKTHSQLSVNPSQQQNLYPIQQNQTKRLNWLFKTRSQIFLSPIQHKLQHHQTRHYNMKNMIPTLTEELLTKKISLFQNMNIFKHPNYHYGKIDQLLLLYDLKKIEQFDNQVFLYFSMLEKSTTVHNSQSLMYQIIGKFVNYKSYSIAYLQHYQPQKIIKIFNLFMNVINKQSLLFFYKWKNILHFIDIILHNTIFLNDTRIANNRQKRQQIYILILKQMNEFIINLDKTRLSLVQLELFLQTFNLFYTIKQQLLLNFIKIQNKGSIIKQLSIKLQQFYLPQSIIEQLEQLFPDQFYKNNLTQQQQIINCLLIKKLIILMNIDDIQINQSLFQKIIIFIERIIDKNKNQINKLNFNNTIQETNIKQKNTYEDHILISQYTSIFTLQFHQKLILFLFNNKPPSTSFILIPSTLNYLWRHLNNKYTKSHHSIQQFLLFFNILIKYNKNALTPSSQKLQFHRKLCETINNIFQLNIQNLINSQISNSLIQSSKEIFDGNQLEQVLKIIKSCYKLE